MSGRHHAMNGRPPGVSRRPILLLTAATLATLALPAGARAAYPREAHCGGGPASVDAVGGPTQTVAWRATPKTRALIYALVGAARRTSRTVGPRDAQRMLVTKAFRDKDGSCSVRVRLPTRPSNGAAWINSEHVALAPTSWRIVVSRAKRTVTLLQAGKTLRTIRVVIGTPATPTPGGLFTVLSVTPWD